MRKNIVPSIEFTVKYKETGLPVRMEEITEEEWAKQLIECDMEGFYIGEDGQLILADECGNFAYVPKEEKYLITLFAGTDVYEIVW